MPKKPKPGTNAARQAEMTTERTRLLLMESDKLPDSVEVTTAEAAALLIESPHTTRKRPQLNWKQRGRRKITTMGDIRKFQGAAGPPRRRPAPRTEAEVIT